jgi:hypothetical protein
VLAKAGSPGWPERSQGLGFECRTSCSEAELDLLPQFPLLPVASATVMVRFTVIRRPARRARLIARRAVSETLGLSVAVPPCLMAVVTFVSLTSLAFASPTLGRSPTEATSAMARPLPSCSGLLAAGVA